MPQPINDNKVPSLELINLSNDNCESLVDNLLQIDGVDKFALEMADWYFKRAHDNLKTAIQNVKVMG